ncbi:hypothetical protein [Microvirga antarctica]|uniref:hypothetical protein n=1 Tax=Microvirga antarctica TaxID=2819233 RepID=UPI001B3059A9|nr:hypothetical protein [Microvirga antarctica]
MTSPLGHLVTRTVEAPSSHAFLYLSDPIKLGRWSLGCFATWRDEMSGIHTGLSLFDGAQGWYRIDPDPSRLLIDYAVGTPDTLGVRIAARIVAGETIGYSAETCLVMLSAWRPTAMDDARWERLCASHEAEIWLIKAQIEKEYRESTAD